MEFLVAMLARHQLPFVRFGSSPASEILTADVAFGGLKVLLKVQVANQDRAAVSAELRARVPVELFDVDEATAALVTLDVVEI